MTFTPASSSKRAEQNFPPPDGKPDLLVQFFDSEFFDEWIAISYLWRTRSEGVIDYLCNKMYSLPDDKVERYLSQLIMLQILRPNPSVERTIIDFCGRSSRLGTQVVWLLSAAAGDSKNPKLIMELKHKCTNASMNGTWLPPFRALSPALDCQNEKTAKIYDPVALRSALAAVDYPGKGENDDELETPTGSPSKMASVYGADGKGDAAPVGFVNGLVSGIGNAFRKIRIQPEETEKPGGEGTEALTEKAAEELAEEIAAQRRETLTATLRMADDLCGLSERLAKAPVEGRQRGLRDGIRQVSDGLVEGHTPGAGVIFPMGGVDSRVVRIPAEEAVLLNSREKAPYLLCLEVVSPDGAEGASDEGGSSPTGSMESMVIHDDESGPSWGASPTSAASRAEESRAEAEKILAAAMGASTPPLHPFDRASTPPLGTARSSRTSSVANMMDSGFDSTPPRSITHSRRGSGGAEGAPAARSMKPPLDPSLSSPTAAGGLAANKEKSSDGEHHIFLGGAASVVSAHHRTESFVNISQKVDQALAGVWDGPDEPTVRVSLAVMDARGGGGRSSRSSSQGGESDDGGKSGEHVRVTVFVENPLGRKPPGVKSPPHQRTPSDVGLMEMADFVHKQSWAPPADARDVTALPSPTGADGETTPTKGGTPRDSVNGGVPSPWKRSAGGLGENWVDKVERVRTNSPYGNFPGWSLKPVIIKAGDNCRQELLAIQLARVFQRIYSDAGLPLWLRPFEVIATSTTSAFIEAVTDAPSIHAIKSRAPRGTSLRQHFEAKFGGGGTAGFRVAQRNFVESLAGYSILTYVLQVKDRHNGNILLSDDGHLIHIDFNFMLSTSPGGINFESSPFKLTREYLEVMDSDDAGIASEAFNYYKVLCIQGYLALRRHAERILLLVEMMSASGTPCFKAGPKVLNNLRKRFNLGKTEEQCVEIMLSMISDSIDAWCTRQYDFYQRVLNGIL